MLENHLSLFETAVKFGIPRDWTVNQWHRIYTTAGASGLYRTNRAKMKHKSKLSQPVSSPVEDVSVELERLRTEVAYLKKLQALVGERIARESGNVPKPSKD